MKKEEIYADISDYSSLFFSIFCTKKYRFQARINVPLVLFFVYWVCIMSTFVELLTQILSFRIFSSLKLGQNQNIFP